MEQVTLTTEQLGNIIQRAFRDGMNWGETYSGWFIPEAAETNKRLEDSKKHIIQFVNENYAR